MHIWYWSSIFLTESGKLYAYGYNGYGQVGDGTTTNVNTIKRIGESEFTHPITKILCTMAATYGWTAVQDSQGQVWTTGNHSNYGLSPTGTIFQKQTNLLVLRIVVLLIYQQKLVTTTEQVLHTMEVVLFK